MHILCTICSDLVNEGENLYVTKCGHIFHQKCLAQWLEKGTTCPQCRNEVTDKCMFRLYPTVSNEHPGDVAATVLDDVLQELLTQQTKHKELQDKLATATQDMKKKDQLLKATKKRLVRRESDMKALRQMLKHVKLQRRQAAKKKAKEAQRRARAQATAARGFEEPMDLSPFRPIS